MSQEEQGAIDVRRRWYFKTGYAGKDIPALLTAMQHPKCCDAFARLLHARMADHQNGATNQPPLSRCPYCGKDNL